MKEFKDQLTDEFGTKTDPLEELDDGFKNLNGNPFDDFLNEVIYGNGKKPKTVDGYERVIRQWLDYMADKDRHPVCPKEEHVKGFALDYLRSERGNTDGVVKEKLWQMGKAFNFFQIESLYPHPSEYNPIDAAMVKIEGDLNGGTTRERPDVSLDDIRKTVKQDVTNIRDRAVIVPQAKLGLRAGELCNIQIQDFHIANAELLKHYPEMGTHPRLDGRENAIYIPPATDNDFDLPGREKNKSVRPRVLPLDDDLRQVFLDYLLIRPDVDRPWFLLSKTNYTKLDSESEPDRIWKKYLIPPFGETDRHRAVRSHDGRHAFTTYWDITEDIADEYVDYMRGDRIGKGRSGAVQNYLHVHYRNIESLYLTRMFPFNL